jgi:hypothetical protein
MPVQAAPQQEARSLAVMHVLFELSRPSPDQPLPQLPSTVTSSAAVPVYQRNCTFLI